MKERCNVSPRERIVAAADQLFYLDGIRATGTDKIMAVADVAKATFYKEFASKDALVMAYLDIRDAAFWNDLYDPQPPKDIDEAITRIDRLSNRAGVVGCPFTLVASEYRNPDHPFHRRVREHKDKILALFLDLLKPLGMDEAVAMQLLMAVDGALSLRLLYGLTARADIRVVASAILSRSAR